MGRPDHAQHGEKMQFLKTLFWVMLAIGAVLFARENWVPAEIKLWSGLIAEVSCPSCCWSPSCSLPAHLPLLPRPHVVASPPAHPPGDRHRRQSADRPCSSSPARTPEPVSAGGEAQPGLMI
jgi:hypothetical protein